MGSFIKLLVVSAFIGGSALTVNHGYDLLTQELSLMVGQTYGSIGAQLEQGAACSGCPDSQAGQDLRQVNSSFQQALRASSDR